MVSRAQRPRKRRRKLRVFRVFLLAMIVVIAGAGVYFYNVYNDVVNAVDKMHKPISRTVSQKRTTALRKLMQHTPMAELK